MGANDIVASRSPGDRVAASSAEGVSLSGSSPVLPSVSGVSATAAKGGLLSGGKAVIAVVLTVAVVAGAAGIGLWLYLHPSPKLQVVQRNTSQIFLSGPGKMTLVARCFVNETLLGGGYDAPGAIVTRATKSNDSRRGESTSLPRRAAKR